MYFSHVTSHVPNLVKWFRTYFTMIWFFPTMKPSMHFKTRLCCDFFATLLTRVVISVHPHVRFEIRGTSGFSPVWICVWFFRFPSDRKVFWQVLQTIVAVLWICTMLCFLRECLRLNVCLQMLQGNGRASLCCSSLWTFKWPGLPKFFSHRGHWWFLSPSWNTEKCLFM